MAVFVELDNGSLFRIGNEKFVIGCQYGQYRNPAVTIDGLAVIDREYYEQNYAEDDRGYAAMCDCHALAREINARLAMREDDEDFDPLIEVFEWQTRQKGWRDTPTVDA